MSNRVPSHRRFSVDNGAQLSVVAPTPADLRCHRPGLFLQAVNTSPSTTFSTCSLFRDIDLQHLFLWVFVVADIPCAIHSEEFLAAFDLLVDCRQSRLHDKTSPTSVPPHVHHIRTTGPPMFPRPCRFVPARLTAAKAEFEHMLQMGIIRQSESPRASPLHMVPKAVIGDWRPRGDYRVLNNVTVSDRYPIPHLQGFTDALFGQSVFSKIDLVRASHETPIAPEYALKTALITLFGFRVFAHAVEVALAYATLLTHFSLDGPTSLMADASNVAVGTVLQQHLQLSPAQTHYGKCGRELLAVFLAVKHFRHFLEGGDFIVFTDHKPLSFALKSTSEKLSPREIRQLD
ncbi:hypothetical protein SprV_0100188300 [Sparganum proliferum]